MLGMSVLPYNWNESCIGKCEHGREPESEEFSHKGRNQAYFLLFTEM